MVLINKMRSGTKFLLLAAFIFSFACEDKGLFIDCAECLTSEPVKTDLDIKLELPEYNSQALITVYEGNIEDSIVYTSYKIAATQSSVQVTLNKKYTVTEAYNKDGNYYIAIDSATPRVRYEKSQCDDPCYFIYDKEINLRLKYE